MDWTLTSIIAVAALGVAVTAGWRGARQPDPRRPARLIPWRLIMVLAAAVLLYMMVHMLNLMGGATGRTSLSFN